jgi:hypothetical protein
VNSSYFYTLDLRNSDRDLDLDCQRETWQALGAILQRLAQQLGRERSIVEIEPAGFRVEVRP